LDGVALVDASLSPGIVTVAPGGEATCTLTVHNHSLSVQRVGLEVCGEATAWTDVESDGVSLLPGQQRDLVVRFRPPKAPLPHAGNLPFALKVTPRDDPGESVVEEGDIVVNSFMATTAAIEPRTSTGFRRGRHVVRVHNGGNEPASVQLEASDPSQLLQVETSPSTLTLDPGYVGQARIEVRTPPGSRRGERGLRPFQVKVRTQGAGTLVLDAGMHLRSFPLVVLAPVLVAVAALVMGGVFYASRNGEVRDATLAIARQPATTAPVVTTAVAPTAVPTTAPGRSATSVAPRTSLSASTTTIAASSGESGALAMGTPCRATSDLRTNGKVLSSPDGGFVRQFPDDATARAARDLLGQHGTVCTIGDPAQGDSLLTFYPPPIEATPNVPGSKCSPRYTPASLAKNQTSTTFAVDIGPSQHLLYAKQADRDRAFALLQGHSQICWLGGGNEDIFSAFFDWTSAVTYF
jgi:hypothetical protein